MKAEQPFWFWNDVITRDEVERQILEMKHGGVGGFFLHPRQGMDLPYMSRQYLDMVRFAVDVAKREKMSVWLYDEYPYPSGVAGGELLLTPEYRARNLLRFATCAADGQDVNLDLPWGRIILAKAYPVSDRGIDWKAGIDLTENIGIIYETEIFQKGRGLTEYNQKRFFTGSHAKRLSLICPQGDWEIRVFVEREADHFKYFGGFADPLNPQAMQEYLNLIHNRYEKVLGDEFGHTIQGIFTDEVAPFAGGDLMWSPILPERFEKEKGYSLIEALPLLFEDGEGAFRVRYDYHDVVTRLFEESFDWPISLWCRQNHLIYTGEKPHLRASHAGYMHMPGCDTGHQKAGDAADFFGTNFRSNPKVVASAAHFYGNGLSLCEAYHSVGWGMTLRDMRWMADWIGIQGIRLFVPHAFYYSTASLRKHDAPPSEFACMPWWKDNILYSSHVDRLCALQEGRRVVPLLVLDPTVSLWTAGEGRSNASVVNARYQAFVDLQKELLLHQLDFYVVDTDILCACQVQDGKICWNGEIYEALILPAMDAIEPCALEKLEELVAAGASVRALETLPWQDIGAGYPKPALDILRNHGLCVYGSVDALCEVLVRAYSSIRLRVLDEVKGPVLSAQFEGEDKASLILCNTSRYYLIATLAWDRDSDHYAWEDLDGSSPVMAESTTRNGERRFLVKFAPFETKILTTTEAPVQNHPTICEEVSLHVLRPMRVTSPNLLRIGSCETVWNGQKIGVTEPMPIVDQMEMAGCSIPTQVVSAFGCDKEYGFAGVDCQYRFQFVNEVMGTRHLLVEEGAVRGGLRILLNGQDVTDRLQRKRYWNANDTQADVTDLCNHGLNEIVLCGHVTRAQDGWINPIYLVGDFGCWKQDGIWHLRTASREGAIGDRITCGLPFYAGDIFYTLPETDVPNTAFELEHWAFEDAAELFVDGVSCGKRAWNPYRWLVEKEGSVPELRVSTTLLPAFEGQHFDPESHSMQEP